MPLVLLIYSWPNHWHQDCFFEQTFMNSPESQWSVVRKLGSFWQWAGGQISSCHNFTEKKMRSVLSPNRFQWYFLVKSGSSTLQRAIHANSELLKCKIIRWLKKGNYKTTVKYNLYMMPFQTLFDDVCKQGDLRNHLVQFMWQRWVPRLLPTSHCYLKRERPEYRT